MHRFRPKLSQHFKTNKLEEPCLPSVCKIADISTLFVNTSTDVNVIFLRNSISSLKNEDGWHGMLVHDRTIGFTRFDIEKYTNTFGSGIEQLEYVIDGVLKHCAWTSQTKVNEMISFTESEILEVKEEMAARIINEEDLEEELGDLMFDVLLLMKICQRDFNGRVSYDRALKRGVRQKLKIDALMYLDVKLQIQKKRHM